MKKTALFALLLVTAVNACAMDLSKWLSEEQNANKAPERIEKDARELVAEGKMTQEELELVLASIKN
jgi:hypothetical protein